MQILVDIPDDVVSSYVLGQVDDSTVHTLALKTVNHVLSRLKNQNR